MHNIDIDILLLNALESVVMTMHVIYEVITRRINFCDGLYKVISAIREVIRVVDFVAGT